MTSATPTLDTQRVATLRTQFIATVDLLLRRRAAEIVDGYIEDYVALHWLEWQGGSLRLTTTGENVRRQQILALARPAV